MSVIMIVAAIAFWAACGVLAYGLTFAHFQRQFPTLAEEMVIPNRCLALEMAISGPIGLAAALIAGGYRYGLMFRSQRRNR